MLRQYQCRCILEQVPTNQQNKKILGKGQIQDQQPTSYNEIIHLIKAGLLGDVQGHLFSKRR